jgi:tRNA (guanine37-N1)-methyltransferase
MHFDVVSLFPEVITAYMDASIMGRAQRAGLLSVATHDLRTWTHDKHRTVDDEPFGGGQGMLMKPAPIFEAVGELASCGPKPHVVFFSPVGTRFDQAVATRFASYERVLMVCGRYEGMDERAYELASEVLSLGDYVLTGGELAALCVMDATARLLPGVLGDEQSYQDESFSEGLLEYAQYTRPANYEGREVPPVLLSGDHGKVAAWRRQSRLERTALLRPDLIETAQVTSDERALMRKLARENIQGERW